MDDSSLIYVSGHSGLIGSSIVRALKKKNLTNIIFKSSSELDLRDQSAVYHFFKIHKIDYVFHAAARVGGIEDNRTHQADYLLDNLLINTNVIKAASENNVKKFLYLGSSCMYPRDTTQPMEESSLLTGKVEPTNEGYAIAKIAGAKLCEKLATQYGKNFISVVPTGVYGPHDNFDPQRSHVVPGLLRRFHEAKVKKLDEVSIWGSGKPLREFLFVDDCVDALIFLMESYNEPDLINIGSDQECSTLELAKIVAAVVGYQGRIILDKTKPDGVPRKLLSSKKINALGWNAKTCLKKGLEETYAWACSNIEEFKLK